MFAIKLAFSILLGVIMLITIIVIYRSNQNHLIGVNSLNRRRIIFKYDLDSATFSFRNKTHLLKNKSTIQSLELLDYVDPSHKDEVSKMINFLSNVSRNSFLFKESNYEIVLKDNLSFSNVHYKMVFKTRVNNVVYGEMSRVGDSQDYKVKLNSELDKTFKSFEESILNKANITSFSIKTIEPIVEDDISALFDEKSVHNIISIYYQKIDTALKKKKVPYYIDRNRRLTYVVMDKGISENTFSSIDKILDSQIIYQNMNIHLGMRHVGSVMDNSPTPTKIKEMILKNMFLLTEVKNHKLSKKNFASSDQLEFEKFLEKVDSINEIFEKGMKTIDYKPFLYVNNAKTVAFSPVMDLYGGGLQPIKDYFEIARSVQMDNSLFSLLMERVMFDFFTTDKSDNAVLFLPIPIDMIDKFISLQNILREKIQFSKDKVVVMLFDYHHHTVKKIISQTRMVKKIGFKIGFYDVDNNYIFSKLESLKPTFFVLSKEFSNKINSSLDTLVNLKMIKNVCDHENSFAVAENIDNFQSLQTFIDNGVDIVSGTHIYNANEDMEISNYIPNQFEKIKERNRF